MKTKLERFTSGLMLAPLAPLAGLLVFWWGAYAFLPEAWIPVLAITGLVGGILADILLLKKLLDRPIGLPLWVAAFLFYSIGVFGFFMGVPVFNTLLAIPAGFVIGARLAGHTADRQTVHKAAQRTAWFTSAVLALICTASGLIALASPSTAADLRGMLGLGFEVTPGMLIAFILVGCAVLLSIGWGLSIAATRITYKFLKRQV